MMPLALACWQRPKKRKTVSFRLQRHVHYRKQRQLSRLKRIWLKTCNERRRAKVKPSCRQKMLLLWPLSVCLLNPPRRMDVALVSFYISSYVINCTFETCEVGLFCGFCWILKTCMRSAFSLSSQRFGTRKARAVNVDFRLTPQYKPSTTGVFLSPWKPQEAGHSYCLKPCQVRGAVYLFLR